MRISQLGVHTIYFDMIVLLELTLFRTHIILAFFYWFLFWFCAKRWWLIFIKNLQWCHQLRTHLYIEKNQWMNTLPNMSNWRDNSVVWGRINGNRIYFGAGVQKLTGNCSKANMIVICCVDILTSYQYETTINF